MAVIELLMLSRFDCISASGILILAGDWALSYDSIEFWGFTDIS